MKPLPIRKLFYATFLVCYLLSIGFCDSEEKDYVEDCGDPDGDDYGPSENVGEPLVVGRVIKQPIKSNITIKILDDYEANFEAPHPTTDILKLNKSDLAAEEKNAASQAVENIGIYACGDKNDDDDKTINKLCKCKKYNIFDCYNDGRRHMPIIHTNLTILKANFTVKKAIFTNNAIQSLKKDSILPGHENTIEELIFDRGFINFIENGTFDKLVNLKKLSLSHNPTLKEIHEGILTPKLGKTLKELYLSFCGMETMELKIFQNYTKLNKLDLGNNHALALGGSTIFPEGLSNLKFLSLKYCKLTDLRDDFFKNLINLKELHLKFSESDVTSIPTSIKTLSNLEVLSISSYAIESIKDCAFCGQKKLTKINLGFNPALKYIHENAFGSISTREAPPIKHFTIWFTAIEVLPEKLLEWKNIEIMEIDSVPFTCNCSMAWLLNDLKSFNSIYKKSIKHLKTNDGYGGMDEEGRDEFLHNGFFICHEPPNFYGISLLRVPDEFCNSTNNDEIDDDTEIIYVCGENEETETNCICEGHNLVCSDGVGFENFNHPGNIQIMDPDFILKIAKFDHFGIKSLKKDKLLPGREQKITELIFNFNEANHDYLHIENGTFDNFISLRTLQLIYQKLTNISDGVLTKSVGAKLLHLNLGFNIFPNLNSIGFMHLTKLTHLNLEFNEKIDFALPENIFPEFLANLHSLNLVGCKIKNFNDAVFIHLKNLKTLLLTQNYITTIPKAFYHLQNLKHLRMDQNKLTTLVKNQFENNTKLENLNMDYNEFSTVEDCTFCNLPNLKNIYLSKYSPL